VLDDVAELVERCVPAKVWLKLLNCLDGGRWYVLQDPLESLLAISRPVFNDGKFGSVIGRRCGRKRELPGQMVEGESQVGDAIASDEAEFIRRRCGLDMACVVEKILPNIFVVDDLTGVCFVKGPKIPVKHFEVVIRPFDRQPRLVEWVHEVDSEYDR